MFLKFTIPVVLVTLLLHARTGLGAEPISCTGENDPSGPADERCCFNTGTWACLNKALGCSLPQPTPTPCVTVIVLGEPTCL
ncbi:hypothetical protein BT96DRAFT_921610 [Gymnopus androsaceus JB14]|uniref:CBM1 domain-containing protein n=1 Tax=Gymnopus androsaceus JB14 TaxID=1447944 RepID=A0A6A4HJR6_9AGAR|nr:hypothetical protein BT96DRAFT_921610 [Gymnopus androsaceus JB14]